jgi:GH25 family lysozyme M1 (1,4-beta-N-acetylmuramidase)
MALAIGQTTTTTRVNVRQGQPGRIAPVLRKLDAGTPLAVYQSVQGENIQGNATWYQTDDQGFVWSGGCAPFQPAPAQAAQPAAAAPPVVDLSHHNRDCDFAAARAAGVIGIVHKATTGQGNPDPKYAERRDAALKAGLLWGAYHWGTLAPVDQQLDNFLNTAAPDETTLVALDFETTLGDQMTLDGARAFLAGIEARLGRRAVLYCGGLLKQQLGATKDAFLGGHRLWLAQYGPRPVVQASWSTFWLWQYTDGLNTPTPEQVPGIPGNDQGCVDCNHFMGSEAELRAQWAAGIAVA